MVKKTDLHDFYINNNKGRKLLMIKIKIKEVEVLIFTKINKVEMLIPWMKIHMVNNTLIM